MQANKRKTLEAAGWKVGSGDEFLGLTRDNAAGIDMKLPPGESHRSSEQPVANAEMATPTPSPE